MVFLLIEVDPILKISVNKIHPILAYFSL